jgi:hypothetical protein
METRLDTYSGWQMTAQVETRPATSGQSCFFVVEPLSCREGSQEEPFHPARRELFTTGFETPDEAFCAAFGVCRRAIRQLVHRRDNAFNRSENGQ